MYMYMYTLSSHPFSSLSLSVFFYLPPSLFLPFPLSLQPTPTHQGLERGPARSKCPLMDFEGDSQTSLGSVP